MNDESVLKKRGEPLPGGELVLRLARSMDGKVTEAAFILSSEDEKSSLQSLSVWSSRMTTVEQARDFLGETKETYDHVFRLEVARVRAIRPDPDSPDVPTLDVVWDPLKITGEDGKETLDPRPGAEGHAGLTGLVRPKGAPKRYYLSLRSKLVDLANENVERVV